jgi:hypothetical protein
MTEPNGTDAQGHLDPEIQTILARISPGLPTTIVDISPLIAERLYDRVGLNLSPHDGWTIADYANYARDVKKNRSRAT